MKPEYCTQNDGNCTSCSLSNYGRDCANNRILTTGLIAKTLLCHERAARKLLNDAGANPRLDEYTENPSEVVPRALVIDLVAIRPDRVGRKLVELLR